MNKRRLLPLILLTMAACRKGEWTETTACMSVADIESCPSADEVDQDAMWVSGWWCGADVQSVEGEGTFWEDEFTDTGGSPGARCCYPVVAREASTRCDPVGRPFHEQGQVKVAAFEGPEPQTPLAKAWLEAARMEHASVAAFSRLTLDLMAVGAPLELLAQLQSAAADEVRHARLTFELASELSGVALRPGPFPMAPITPRTDLAAIAFDAVVEGCIGETMGAYLARQIAQDLPPGAQRDVLEALAEDEERHAALSWGIVAWLLKEGGEPVRQAVALAFQQPTEVGGVMALLAGEDLPALLKRGGRSVLDPAARALLAA